MNHLETRESSGGKGGSDSVEVYIEINLTSITSRTEIRSILETLNAIDIHPREDNRRGAGGGGDSGSDGSDGEPGDAPLDDQVSVSSGEIGGTKLLLQK